VVAGLAGCQGAGEPAATPESVEIVNPDLLAAEQAHTIDAAQAAADAGDYETALAMFREVLAENPTATSAYLGIGDVYMAQQDYAKAEPQFRQAARLEPRNFDAQFGHGRALQLLNRLVEAVKAYHRALVIQPEHPQANLNMATTYLQLGEPHNAITFAENAVAADPENGSARATLGSVYESVGRYAEAIDQYDAALDLMEPSAPLLINLINALGKVERFDEAKNTAEMLVRLDPSAVSYERLGWAHFRMQDFAASMTAYRRAVELDPAHWPSLNGVGVNAMNTWLRSAKKDEAAAAEAKDALQRSLQANPDQPRVLALLERYQWSLGP
jgi:tetratricopeptide (TPR) repeat protein